MDRTISTGLLVLSFERLTIECVAEVKSTFLQVLTAGQGAILNFDNTKAIDLAGIQLLFSFFREAEQRGIPLRCSGMMCDKIVERLKLFGLDKEACTSPEQLYEIMKPYFPGR